VAAYFRAWERYLLNYCAMAVYSREGKGQASRSECIVVVKGWIFYAKEIFYTHGAVQSQTVVGIGLHERRFCMV